MFFDIEVMIVLVPLLVIFPTMGVIFLSAISDIALFQWLSLSNNMNNSPNVSANDQAKQYVKSVDSPKNDSVWNNT